MNISIRQAQKDDVRFIARMILAALHIEEDANSKLAQRMAELVADDGTLYSWQRCFIAEHTPSDGDGSDNDTAIKTPVGLCLAYDAADYHERRMRAFTMKCSDGTSVSDDNQALLEQEDEAGAGEYYIDSLAVTPECRGKGVGTILLNHAIDKATALGLHPTLLVDPDNPPAVNLYTSLGFRFLREQMAFGVVYHKYQYSKQ